MVDNPAAMPITYDTRSVEIFVGGQKVDHSGAIVTYDPPKPTFAEYLKRRERALDYMANWRAHGLITNEGDGMVALIMATRATKGEVRYNSPPPRDRIPLPLP
jgi:hypothetical protein